jgi:hypothetical protein
VGKRQRHTQFIHLTDAEVLALIEDPNTPDDIRRKAMQEAKWRGLRNIQKRSSR